VLEGVVLVGDWVVVAQDGGEYLENMDCSRKEEREHLLQASLDSPRIVGNHTVRSHMVLRKDKTAFHAESLGEGSEGEG